MQRALIWAYYYFDQLLRFCISVFINVVIIVLNYTHLLPLAEGDLVTMTTTKKLVKDNEDIAASATGEVRK